MFLDLGERKLDLKQPKIMGVLNMTPDSFSDGGKYLSVDDAFSACVDMVKEGASVIDIGGESTRPGSVEVSSEQQLDRVIPIILKVKQNLDTIISIDSGDAAVIKEATDNGAEIVNDVFALTKKNAINEASKAHTAVCLMHMKGKPISMQDKPIYNDLLDEIKTFLDDRVNKCIAAGIKRNSIIIDPGFGFGKTVSDNLILLKNLRAFSELKIPICIGLSRKSFIGEVTNRSIDQRVSGSLSAALIAIQNGANIIRTHDVGPTKDAIEIHNSLQRV